MELRDELEVQEGILHFNNISTVDMAKKYGTPLYLLSHDLIKSRCEELKTSFLEKYDNVRAVYAGKAFSSLAMCKIIDREDIGLDVVSGGELYTAIKANFPMEKIIFHGNNKSYFELVEAVKNNVGRIVVDNFYELEMLDEITRSLNKKTEIFYRITPGVEADTHSYISTGQKDSKFGIPITGGLVYKAVELVSQMELIDFRGFHFHVGSQLMDNTSHLGAIKQVVKIIKKIKTDFNIEICEMNIGGGFGISYSGQGKTKDLDHFLEGIMEVIEEEFQRENLLRPQIIIEPGRWLVGDAGITVYEVGSIKEIPGIRTYLAVDGGMTDNLRPALYQAEYEAVVANRANAKREDLVRVVGKCCESGDILINEINLQKATPGDYLAIFNTGAYGYSMANNYNRNTRPPVVLLTDTEDNIIIERESYEDLIKNDKVPNFLNK